MKRAPPAAIRFRTDPPAVSAASAAAPVFAACARVESRRDGAPSAAASAGRITR